MEWYVNITGEKSDLVELSKSLNSPELYLINEGKEFIIKSTDFDQLKTADEVRNKASEILSQLNGTARLVIGMRNSIDIAHVVKVNDDRRKDIFISVLETLYVRDSHSISIKSKNGTVRQFRQADVIKDYLSVARNDKNVAKVLRLYGLKHDWVNMYRIFEVIECDIRNISKVYQKGWVKKSAIDLFKHTANSVGAIGDESRHGKETKKPPQNPMTFSEAKSLIDLLINCWLRNKRKIE